jgi:acyl-coenzyme A synthetase/AMP-(fatty) acid ligase
MKTNFSTVLGAADPRQRALVELSRTGTRREWTFHEVSDRSARLAGTLAQRGVRRGDVVMTLIGNRSEWVFAMVAIFRLGAVALPCTEQLRAKDLLHRINATSPVLIIADERNVAELRATGSNTPVVTIPDESLFVADRVAPVGLADDEPCLVTFTSGTSGVPKPITHAQRYLFGQHTQARYWLDARPGELVWCTAASGWSKSARNVFVAPWLQGAAALLHDQRFEPKERLEVVVREGVDVLCMAPTEYRVITKRTKVGRLGRLRHCVAAGEALNPGVLHAWHAATGLWIHDGYGQTETGQLTGTPLGERPRPGSMGRPLPGLKLWIEDGELIADPSTIPTFCLGAPRDQPWRTGDRVREEDGYLYFEGRRDDIIISSGYRIGPFEVESALVGHPAVAEAAVVAAPDEERGSVVRAVVVLKDGVEASDALADELRSHVKAETAPYKYPRIVEFTEILPKTSSGKIRRAELRASYGA